MTKTVSASPTKDFFISMLTRDISLISSIVDLVDNSVDAALSLDDLSNRYVRLNLNCSSATIIDNCGGISYDAATNYAFKFGRPPNTPNTPHSVGRFGVGMKRALFKMGNIFNIKSRHSSKSFEVSVNVDKWVEDDSDWTFDISDIDQGDHEGTEISITSLHQSVSESFSDQVFLNQLQEQLEKAHFKILSKGFSIYLNDEKIGLEDILVHSSDNLGAVTKSLTFGQVSVILKAGIGERNFHQGGWNILCNDRLIEAANKGKLTGWGSDGIRAYHPDFAFFRGIVEFRSEDGALLPWNTTKTGIDSDNPVYRSTLVQMKATMRTIMEFLKERVNETENKDAGLVDEAIINPAIDDAPLKSIFDIEIEEQFRRPAAMKAKAKKPKRGNISYSVPLEELEEVKEALGASSNKEVGELTFEYYVENEL